MRVSDEARRDDARRAREFGHLITAVPRVRNGPTAPRPIERPPHFLTRRAGRHRRFECARRAKDPPAERSEADALDGIGLADEVDDAVRQLGVIDLQLDDDRQRLIAPQDGRERRHADPAALERPPALVLEATPGIGTRQLAGRHCANLALEVGRPLERPRRGGRQRRRHGTGARRARDHPRRVPGRCQTPPACFPAPAHCRRGARTPAAATI